MRVDPLIRPEPLIKRVYAYAAYRLGDGPDAEDATSDTFERALRYRASYDRSKGEPVAWLLGIARRCVDDLLETRPPVSELEFDIAAPGELEPDTIRNLTYGADLTARQIAELLGERTNTIEVALHRALGRLRAALAEEQRQAGASGAPIPKNAL